MVILWVVVANPSAHLSENQFLYVFSSAAQVVGGIYGLTIAGYIFLRNQQDRRADRDETLVEILDRIQGAQFRFVLLLTVLSISSVFSSLLALAVFLQTGFGVRSVLTALALALFIATVWWTGRFVLHSLRPGTIERASKAIKAEVETSSPRTQERPGGLEKFLVSFNKIEALLDGFAERHLSGQAHQSLAPTPTLPRSLSGRPRWTKSSVARALYQQEVLDTRQVQELLTLIQYRNALVHGQDLTVSDEMVHRVEVSESELRSGIEKYDSQVARRSEP